MPRHRPPPSRPVTTVPGLALVAVLLAHGWVLDAWSLPREVPVQQPTPLARPSAVTALPLPTPQPVPPTPEVESVRMPLPRPAARAEVPPRPDRVSRPSPAATVPTADQTPATRIPDSPPLAEDTPSAPDTLDAPTLLALASPGAGPAPSPAAAPPLTAPPSVRLHYRMAKGPLMGTGQIDWQRDADTYRMRLEARVPVFGQIFLETSTGRLDASGLAPLRHTERRVKRSERAVSFVRDQGPPRILFSARVGQEPLNPGAQDRLSWIAQLATRMAAPPDGPWRSGQRIEMDVASTGGDVQHWVFTVLGQDSAGLWQLRREPDSPHDTRAEVWVDPRRHHWPVRIRMGEPAGEPLELTLDTRQPA